MRVLWLLDNGQRNRILAAFADHMPDDVALEVAVLGDAGPLAEQLADRGIPYHPLGIGDPRNLALAVPRLRSLMARTQPDIVHPHLFWSALAAEIARRSLRHRPAMVLGRHHDLNHHIKGKRVHARIDGWLGRRADRVIAVSHAVRSTMIEREDVPAERISVVHNGIAPSELEVASGAVDEWRERLGADPWVIAAGRLDWQKDYPTLARAFAAARERVPRLRLGIAGTGDDGTRAEVEALAVELGVMDAVQLFGWVDDVLALFLAADVFAQASVTEACPQTVMEAASLGVPMAVTAAGGTLEIVGAWHPHIAPGDADALAARIVDVLSDLPAARREAAAASVGVRERFTADRMAAGYLDVYRRVVAAVR